MATDNIQHREGFSPRAKQIYKTMDRFLAELMARMPEDATLIVGSDHGFDRFDYIIDLNEWLSEQGLFVNPAKPDYASSLVFHDQWCVYFNDSLLTRDELLKRGVTMASDQTPRQALVSHLREAARQITNPMTGEKLPVEFFELPDDAIGVKPDLIVDGAYDGYFVEGGDLGIVAKRVVRKADQRSEWFHARDGMVAFWGKGIQPGTDLGVREIADITPTILYMMDLPMAKDFDGKVIDAIFTPDALAAKPAYYLSNYSELKPTIVDSGKELESLEDKLRALGYVK